MLLSRKIFETVQPSSSYQNLSFDQSNVMCFKHLKRKLLFMLMHWPGNPVWRQKFVCLFIYFPSVIQFDVLKTIYQILFILFKLKMKWKPLCVFVRIVISLDVKLFGSNFGSNFLCILVNLWRAVAKNFSKSSTCICMYHRRITFIA